MSITQPSTDSELVTRSARGDKQAFGLLYEQYLDQIYRYVFYRVSDHAKAEDLTQTVFIKVWEKLPAASRRKEIQNFHAWVYRIAHNTVIDYYRTNKSDISLEEFNASRDDSPGPESVVQNNEVGVDLINALSMLDDDMQQVVILRFVNQLSHVETAQILGLSEGYVRVLQYRALQKIKSHLLKRNGQDE